MTDILSSVEDTEGDVSDTETIKPFVSNRAQDATFPRFSELPIELRIQIYESTFTPRRIALKRTSSRPPTSPISFLSLLLVSHESHSILTRHYPKCLTEYGHPGLRFNFNLDVLAIEHSTKTLIKLLQQYPVFMSRVQYMDYRPSPRSENIDWIKHGIDSMVSLRVINIRYLGQRGCGYDLCPQQESTRCFIMAARRMREGNGGNKPTVASFHRGEVWMQCLVPKDTTPEDAMMGGGVRPEPVEAGGLAWRVHEVGVVDGLMDGRVYDRREWHALEYR